MTPPLPAADLRALAERWERAERPDGCWIWPRAKDKRGRGRVWVGKKLMLAHRAVYEQLVGPIPHGALLCHHCDNPSCVNPRHLYVGDAKTNVADMFARRRHWMFREPERIREVGQRNGKLNTWSRGAGNPKAKLTVDQVEAIRSDKRPTRLLVDAYSVDRTTIQRIRSGRLWPAAALRALAAAGSEGR